MIELLFVDPLNRPAPMDQCVDPPCVALRALIDGAHHTLDVAVYGFRSQTSIVDALRRASARGVRVRGVVDADLAGANHYADTDAVTAELGGFRTDRSSDLRLRDARTWDAPDRCRRPAGFEGPLQCLGYDLGESCLLAEHASREALDQAASIMHHKFAVADGLRVWTGSTNVSDSCAGGYNANLAVVVDSPVVASWYTAEFEQMHAEDRFHAEKRSTGRKRASFPHLGLTVDGWFSPTDRPITRAVRPLLQNARSSVDIAVFFLTHKELTRDLIAAHRRGVRVRVLLDATGASNEYSKHALLREAGIPVKIEDWGGKMHMKAAVVDGEHLVVGSMNWTSAGEGGNDENTLVIHGRSLAARFEAEFERLWSSVPDRWLAGRPDPESAASPPSCTDGVDNDHDGLADAADPGCSSRPPPLPELPPHRTVLKANGEGVLLKGVEREGEKLWFWPGHPEYAHLGTEAVWLCSSADAKAAGYRAAPRP